MQKFTPFLMFEGKAEAAMNFYISLFSGFRKMVFPAMLPAYDEYSAKENWDIIEKARSEGYEKAHEYCQQLKRMYDNGDLTQETIEETFFP